MEIIKKFKFDAAHRLPNVPAEHKCSAVHGHTFRVEVRIRGDVESATGWIVDFADVGTAWKPLHAVLDHHFLNDVDGLHNPTSENIARWIWHRLRTKLNGLYSVSVSETEDTAAVFDVHDAAKDDLF